VSVMPRTGLPLYRRRTARRQDACPLTRRADARSCAACRRRIGLIARVGRWFWSLFWEVFVVWFRWFRFRVTVSWRLRSAGPLSRPAVFSWEFASRREAARFLLRLRAARRWWWSVPRLGSAAWCRFAASGGLPPRGTLRWLWAPRFLLGGVVRVSVSVVGCPFAVRVFRVPRARRRPRLLC